MSIFTVGMKLMGMNVKPSLNKNLLIKYFASWANSPSKYAFVIEESHESFKSNKLSKNTITFCKTNNLKLIVVSRIDNEILLEESYKMVPLSMMNNLLVEYRNNP